MKRFYIQKKGTSTSTYTDTDQQSSTSEYFNTDDQTGGGKFQRITD